MSRRQWGEDSTRCVKLAGNGSVTLTFKGNLFELTQDERNLIARLTDALQQHEEKKNGNTTA